jgi:hypothetical protein
MTLEVPERFVATITARAKLQGVSPEDYVIELLWQGVNACSETQDSATPVKD